MAENKVQELFKQKLQSRKIDTIQSETLEIIKKEENTELISNKNLDKTFYIPENIYIGLTTDKELIKYLNDKTRRLLLFSGLGSISIGKELTEVFEKLSKQGSSEGIYEKFLEISGYKRDTALRYRKRYEIFSKLKNNAAKQIISVLPVKNIEVLYKNQNLLKDIDEENIKYSDVVELLSENKKVLPVQTKKDNELFNLGELTGLTNEIQNKYEELKEKDREKLNRLLLEIKKILK